MMKKIKIDVYINAEEETCGDCKFLYHHSPAIYKKSKRCTAFDKWLKTAINSAAHTITIYRCKECKKNEQKIND